MGKAIIFSIIITIALMLSFWLFGRVILEWVSTFVYFFVRDSAEIVAESISGVATVVAGTPGHVELTYNLLSPDYEYVVDFRDKMVLVSSKYEGSSPLNIRKEEMEAFLTNIPSTFGVKFSYAQEPLVNPKVLWMRKDYTDRLRIEINYASDAEAEIPSGLRLEWPTDEKKINSCFGWRRVDKDGDGRKELDFHRGLDIETPDTPNNVPIKAVASGRVLIAGKFDGYGNAIKIEHRFGCEDTCTRNCRRQFPSDNLENDLNRASCYDQCNLQGASDYLACLLQCSADSLEGEACSCEDPCNIPSFIYYTLYGHLKCDGIEVEVGDEVNTGDVIGYSGGDDGCKGTSTGSHLHFELQDANKVAADPWLYLGEVGTCKD